MSSFSPSIFPSLLFSFNMEEIASEAYNNHESLSQLKEEKNTQAFKLHELFTPEGINLCELFGYHLSKRLQKYSLKQRSNEARIVWYEYKDFEKLILNTWTNMGQYESLLPALFQLLKQSFGGYINVRHLDQLAKISRQTIKNDTVVLIKEKVSPQRLQNFQKRVFQVAQKEDLKGAGFIETKKIISIFVQIAGKSVSRQIDLAKLPRQLFQGDSINYQTLFSDEYLLSGQKMKSFMQTFCARKIVKLIRQSNKRKLKQKHFKSEYLKKVIKKQPQIMGQKLSATSKKQQLKQQAKEQIINEMLQKDKKQTQQLMRNKLSMAKELLMEVIFDSVEVAQNVFMREERKMENEKHEEVRKIVYTMEPVVGEMMMEGMWKEGVKVEMLGDGVGIFIAHGQGYTFEITDNTKLITAKSQSQQSLTSLLNPINLSISSLIKPSTIIDYQILHQKLYILRQDGLFYVWSYSNSPSLTQTKQKECYEKMIQTGFKFTKNDNLKEYHKALYDKGTQGNKKMQQPFKTSKVIHLDKQTNIFVINCSSDPIMPSLQLYDSDLNYMARVRLNKSILNPFTYQHLLQAQYFLTHIYPKIKSDHLIKQQGDYIQLLKNFDFIYNKKYQDRLLGLYVLREFNYHCHSSSHLETRHLQLYFSFVASHTALNPIPLIQQWFHELMEFKSSQRQFDKLSKKLLQYLHELNYLLSADNQAELQLLLLNTEIIMVKDRKLNFMTLVEDNFNAFEEFFMEIDFKAAPTVIISQQRLEKLLKICDLSHQQIFSVTQSLPTTVDNFIDLTNIFMTQHTVRVRDLRQNKRSSDRKYKLMSMPGVEVEVIEAILKSDLMIVRQKQGPLSQQKVFLLNTKGQLVNCISIPSQTSSCEYTQLFTTCIIQTNHMICLKFNTVYIYDLNNDNFKQSLTYTHSTTLQATKTINNLLQGTNYSRIIDFSYLYEQGAIVVATCSCVYVFDFDELISSNNQQTRFRLKPGYIAIFQHNSLNDLLHTSQQQHEIKRKHITPSNQFNSQLIVSSTVLNQSVLTIVSYNHLTSDLHVKSIYLVKHQLKITKEYLAKPLPTKLFKQLQSRAKRVYHQDRIKEQVRLIENQQALTKDIANFFKKKLSLQQNSNTSQLSHESSLTNSNSNSVDLKLASIYQLNNIYGLLNNTKAIINQKNPLFSKSTARMNIPERYLRLFVVISVVLSSNEQELQTKLSVQFIAMYRKQLTTGAKSLSSQKPKDSPPQARTNRKQLLNDFATIQQKRFLDRLLYYCSLIDKFIIIINDHNNISSGEGKIKIDSPQQLTAQLMGLVCDEQGAVSVDKIVEIVCQQQQVITRLQNGSRRSQSIMIPSLNLVQSTFATLFQLGRLNLINPLSAIVAIIHHLIPTKYKYLSARYYKQLTAPSSTSSLMNEGNHCDNEIINQFMVNNFEANFINQLSQVSLSHREFIMINVNNCSISKIIHHQQGLTKHLINRNFIDLYINKIEPRHPQVKKNYRQLVEKLYAYKILSLFQMVYMLTMDRVVFVSLVHVKVANTVEKNKQLLSQTLNNKQQSRQQQTKISNIKSTSALDFNKFSSNIQLPISRVIEQLWQSGNFLDRRELVNMMRWSLKELRLKEMNEWIDGGGVVWIGVGKTNLQSKSGKQKQQQQSSLTQVLPQQLLVDPLQLPLITRHLQYNITLTLQSIAHRLYLIHQTLQLSKVLISKTIQVNSYITYKQLVKFIGCESITRWLFKVKHQGQAIYLQDAVLICNRMKDVLCEKLWKYNLLLWGEKNIMCLLGLLKALAESTSTKITSSQNPQSGRRKSTARLTQLAKYFIPCSFSQQPVLNQLTQTSHWATILKYICQKYYTRKQKQQQIHHSSNKMKQSVNKSQKQNNPCQSTEQFFKAQKQSILKALQLLQSAGEITFGDFYQCVSQNILHGKGLILSTLKQQTSLLQAIKQVHQLYQATNNTESYLEQIKMQQLLQFSLPQELELVKRGLQSESSGIDGKSIKGQEIIKNKEVMQENAIGPQVIQKVYSRSCNKTKTLIQFLPSNITVSTWLGIRSHIRSSLLLTQDLYVTPLNLAPQHKSLLSKLYHQILHQQSHQNNTLSEFYLNLMRYQKSSQISIFGNNKQNEMNVFSQFYSKLRSFSPRVLGKLSCYQLSIIYLLLKQDQQIIAVQQKSVSLQSQGTNANNIRYMISFTNLFYYSTILVTPKIKQSWISTYLLTKLSIHQELLQHQPLSKQQSTKQNPILTQSPSQQMQQLLIKFNVYGEIILGNLWHQPFVYQKKNVGYFLQQTINNNNIVDKVIKQLTQSTFDLHRFIYNKHFAKYQFSDSTLSLSLTQDSDQKSSSSKTQFLKKLTNLSLNSNINQFLHLLHQHKPQISRIEGGLLYEYFRQIMNKVKIVRYNVDNNGGNAVPIVEYNPKEGKSISLLLSDCIKFSKQFLTPTNNSKHLQNINLHIQPTSSQYPWLSSYIVNKQSLLLQSQQHEYYYKTAQTTILSTVNNMIYTSINSQPKIRSFVMNAICKMMQSMHVTLERVAFILVGANKEGMDGDDMSQCCDVVMQQFIRIIVLDRLENIKMLPLFSQIDWSNSQIRQSIIFYITQSIIHYDYTQTQRQLPTTMTFQQLRKQLLYHYNNNITRSINSNFIAANSLSAQNSNNNEMQLSYEEVYKEMDVLGVGEVSLNDLMMIDNNSGIHDLLLLSKIPASYVNITTYLRHYHPHIPHKLKYINPNTNLLLHQSQITQQLLSLQQESSTFRQYQISTTGYSANRNKLITKENVYKIMYQYVDQQQMTFIMEWFDTNYQHDSSHMTLKLNKSQFINLSKLIKYLTVNLNKQQDHQLLSTSTLTAIKLLTQWIQAQGGIRRAIRRQDDMLQKSTKIVLDACHNFDIKTKYDNVGDLVIDIITILINNLQTTSVNNQSITSHPRRAIPQQLKATFSFYKELRKITFSRHSIVNISQVTALYLPLAIQQILHYYYTSQLSLNTSSNRQLTRLKSLTIKDLTLLKKIYIALAKSIQINGKLVVNSLYEIFQKLITSIVEDDFTNNTSTTQSNNQSQKMTFNLLDLWEFINKHSLIPSSKKQINQIFTIIDQNNDKTISFKEFVAFWMALQQLLPKSLIIMPGENNFTTKTPMQQLKQTLRESFMSIFNNRIQSSTTSRNPITYTEIMSTFNTQNKQKINKLLQIIFETDNEADNDVLNIVELKGNKGYDSMVMINGIEEVVLDIARLRIVRRVCQVILGKDDKMNQKEANNLAQHLKAKPQADLILKWTADDIYYFILSKTKLSKDQQQNESTKLRQQDLFKYVILKYPIIGRSLIQSLFQINDRSFQWNKLMILLKGIVEKGVEWKSKIVINKNRTLTFQKEQFKSQILTALKTGDSLAKAYHSLSKPKITHFYGESLSFRFIIQQILSQINQLQTATDQISLWIDQCCSTLQDKLPLIYGAKQNLGLLPTFGESKSQSICQIMMKAKYKDVIESQIDPKNPQAANVFQTSTLMQGRLKFSLRKISNKSSQFIEQTISLTKDTRFKSNNLANFSLNIALYADEEIASGGILAIDEIKVSKGQVMKVYTNQEARSILQLSRPNQKNFKCLQSLIQLAELNYKLHKKYRVVGLLMDFSNICLINCGRNNNNEQSSLVSSQERFVLKNFYQGVLLGPDGNFAEGFNLLDLYSHNEQNQPFTIVSLPPQLQQSIYTYAMDSYVFGCLIFLLYSGMDFNTLQKKQQELIYQRKSINKCASENKIQASFYLRHSFVHSQAKQNVQQIFKKMTKHTNSQLQTQLQAELVIFTLIYKCTLYDWYERPQMHQIISVLKQLKQNVLININEAGFLQKTSFFRPFNKQQIILKYFSQKDTKSLRQIIKQLKVQKPSNKQQVWTFEGLTKLKEQILNLSLHAQSSKQTKQLSILLYEYFNKCVRQFLQYLKLQSGLFSQQDNDNGSLMLMKSQSKIFDSNNKNSMTPKNILQLQSASPSQKNWTKFGETQKSMFIDSRNQEWIQNQSFKKYELSPKKMTFLQAQSMLFAQKQTSTIKHPHNQDLTSPQHLKFSKLISQLLQLITSHTFSIQSKPQLRIALYLMKDLLNDPGIKYYLQECDEKWVVPMYDVEGKKGQVNLKDKLMRLPKSSVFYNDFYQLMEEKIVLNLINQSSDTTQQPSTPTSSVNNPQALHQSSKILALNHIISILMSNNLNKLNALYQSNIISKLYIYLNSQDIEIKQKTLCVFLLLTKSLCNRQNNTQLEKLQRKGIDEVYRLMMVVFDELRNKLSKNEPSLELIQEGKSQSQSPKKRSSLSSSSFRITTSTSSPQRKQQKQAISSSSTSNPTISLLTYTQNMYTITGQQCLPFLNKICLQQLCHLYSLIILSQQIYTNRSDNRYIEILQNLLCQKQLFSRLNSHLINLLTPQRIKVMKKSSNSESFVRIQKLLMQFQQQCPLLQLSRQLQVIVNKKIISRENNDKLLTEPNDCFNLIECLDRNIAYFKHIAGKSYNNKLKEQNQLQQQSHQQSLGEYNAFFVHFEKFLKLLSEIIALFVNSSKQNNQSEDNTNKNNKEQQNRLNLLQKSLTYLQLTIRHWQTSQPLINNLLQLLQHFYNNEHSINYLYSSNILQQQCITRLLKITQYLSTRQTSLMMHLGFLHLYSAIIKKQYQRMLLCFDKRVEKNKIVPIYFVQAQWRLTILQAFVGGYNNSNKNNLSILSYYDQQKQVSKQLSNLSFSQYICHQLFANNTLMDLRFYQSFEEGVPFRFCRPFRCQAIVMIGILLKNGENVIGGIQSEVASYIVPLVQPMADKLKNYFISNNINSPINQGEVSAQKQLLQIVEIIWLFSQISQSTDQRLKYQFINSGTHEVLSTVFKKHKKIKLLFPTLAQTIQSNKMLTTSKIFQKSLLLESKRQSRRVTNQLI